MANHRPGRLIPGHSVSPRHLLRETGGSSLRPKPLSRGPPHRMSRRVWGETSLVVESDPTAARRPPPAAVWAVLTHQEVGGAQGDRIGLRAGSKAGQGLVAPLDPL